MADASSSGSDRALSEYWDSRRADFFAWVDQVVDRKLAEHANSGITQPQRYAPAAPTPVSLSADLVREVRNIGRVVWVFALLSTVEGVAIGWLVITRMQ